MNLWLRISSRFTVETDSGEEIGTNAQIRAGLDIDVHRTRELAEAAQREVGGVVLEVDAACLRNLKSESGSDVLLCEEGNFGVKASSSALLTVYCEGELVPNYGPYEPGTVDPQGDLLKPGDQEQAWLNAFKQQTGYRLHQ